MSKGSKIAIVALVIVVMIVAAMALTGTGKVSTAETSMRSFFSKMNSSDFDGAVQYVAVSLTDNATLKSWYAEELELWYDGETVDVNSIQNVNSSLSSHTASIINEGLGLLSSYIGITYDQWTVLYVNITENPSNSAYHYVSDFYVIMIHSGSNWYIVQTSFVNTIDGWNEGWAGEAAGN